MSSSAFSIMLPAFAECLVLVGIHSYLGLHVIKRQVIFVDLALAQIAALGATVGFLFGMAPTSIGAFVFSMVFTFLGAAVFAVTRLRRARIPHEAVIGLVYASAAAITILVVDKSPHGAEHIKDLLTGTILWVKWSTVGTAAVAYAAVGAFHYLLRDRFIAISTDADKAFAAGINVRLWDFLFYLSFGFVISFSVRTAGVLLVFVFLVAPAITAALITDRWRTQLVIGWSMGTVVTTVALYLSYVLDLPSGPTVVAFYAAVLVVTALGIHLWRAADRRRAGFRLAQGVAAALIVVAAVWGLGQVLGASALAHDAEHAELEPAPEVAASGEPAAAASGAAVDTAAQGVDEASDPDVRLASLRRRIASGASGWRRALVDYLLDDEVPLLFKDEARALLRDQAGKDFGFDPEAEDNAAAGRAMRAWAAGSAVAGGSEAARP